MTNRSGWGWLGASALLLATGCGGADDPETSTATEQSPGIQGTGRAATTQGIEGTGRQAKLAGIQGSGRAAEAHADGTAGAAPK